MSLETIGVSRTARLICVKWTQSFLSSPPCELGKHVPVQSFLFLNDLNRALKPHASMDVNSLSFKKPVIIFFKEVYLGFLVTDGRRMGLLGVFLVILYLTDEFDFNVKLHCLQLFDLP